MAVALVVACRPAAADELLPGAKPVFPSYSEMAKGPLRVRLRPGTKTPGLIEYCAKKGAKDHMAAAKRLETVDSWWLATGDPQDQLVYLKSGKPVTVTQHILDFYTRKSAGDTAIDKQVRFFQQNAKGDLTFEVGEWENYLNAWWDKNIDSLILFDKTDAELRAMDRRGVYETMVRALRAWKARVGGHLSLANGYGLLSHCAEIGLDAIGTETSENIPGTQVQRAFCRGAARQFGIPWFEQISVWYANSVAAACPAPDIYNNGFRGGPDCGHSLSHLARHWYTAWFGGAAYVMPEASQSVLYNLPWGGAAFPADAELSPYGVEAAKLAKLMRTADIGVPYTPFAVVLDKYHGRWTVWGKPWGRFAETTGDKMIPRFFDQLFPGQSLGPGREERYLCPSPYGDTFDVLVNNADRTAWSAYPVILAIGDISWTADEAAFLRKYVADGGILALSQTSASGLDRQLTGVADGAFGPTADAETVMTSAEGTPLLIRRDIGRGHVFVSAADEETPFPKTFLDALAARLMPFRVNGKVETLVNRTRDGWALMIVNNNGITKDPKTAPVVDPSAVEHVRLTFEAKTPAASELIAAEPVACVKSGDKWTLDVDVPPGELRLLKITEGR